MAFAANCRLTGNGTNLTSFSIALTGWTAVASGGTAPQVGDIVVLITTCQVASNTFSQTAGTSWTIHSTDNNGGTNPMTTAIATRQWDGTETSPTFAWTTGSRGSWGAWAYSPGTGNIAVVDVWATPKIDATAAVQHTANSATTANTDLSLLAGGFVAATKSTTAITVTSPTGWVGAGGSSLAGTTTTFSVFCHVDHDLSATGTVTPGVDTTNVSTQAVVYHVLIMETPAPVAVVPARVAPFFLPRRVGPL